MATLDLTPRHQQRATLSTYPNPYFDQSQYYLPYTLRELFRWTLHLYMTHAEIFPAINKRVAYVLTDLIYDFKSEPATEAWRNLFRSALKFRKAQRKLGVDFAVYGNAYASILYPFNRFLICKACGYKSLDRATQWVYENFQFRGACRQCKNRRVVFDVKDVPSRERSRVRLKRWSPLAIDIRYNPFTEASQFIYRVPRWIRARMTDPIRNRVLVEDTPMVIIEAVRDGKNIELDPDNVYHFKNETISYIDDAYGMPPLLAAFKEAWLYQTLKRAEEVAAREHALPLTVLSPAPLPGTANAAPHANYDLAVLSAQTDHMITTWRRDENSIYTLPFPFNVTHVRGDLPALDLSRQKEMARQMIIGALDLPQEFIYGGLTYSGSSVSLRVLENIFLNDIAHWEEFIDWTRVRIGRYFGMPDGKITHADFKMADDAAQKQIWMGLRNSDTLSRQTLLRNLGIPNYQEELKRIKEEQADAQNQMADMMVTQAEAQAKATRIATVEGAKAQAEAELAVQKIQMKAQAEAADALPGSETGQALVAASQPQASPSTMGSMAMLPPGSLQTEEKQKAQIDNIMQTMSPTAAREYIDALAQTNPGLAQRYREMAGKRMQDNAQVAQAQAMTEKQQQDEQQKAAQSRARPATPQPSRSGRGRR